MNVAALSSRRRAGLLDAGLAALLAMASGALLFLYVHDAGGKLDHVIGTPTSLREHLLLWSLAAAGCVAALVIRHRSPAAALVLAGGGVAVHYADSRLPHLPLDLAAPIALYTVASMARARRASCAALAGTLAIAATVTLVPLTGLITKGSLPPATVVARFGGAAAVPVLVLVIAWVAGDAARTRRAYLRALQLRAADLERERGQRDALAAAAERARLTREMHDVVAHGLSVMVAQAQGAAAALRRHPERTRAALDEVIGTGRQSLAEMRQLLGAARGGCTDDPALSPQPGLGSLPGLVDQVRLAGTQVQLTVDGEPTALPAALDLAAYRIVQEALTNTRKHAGDGARASVRVAFRGTWMEIDVADGGQGIAHANGHGAGGHSGDEGAGNGLRGIRERVELLGGQITAGPRPEGGFRVHAIMPLRALP